MGLPTAIRRWVFWDFGRNSIPYEIVCVVYIALLVFVPASSTGWFNEGQRVILADGSVISLRREGVVLSLTWEETAPRPDDAALENFVHNRFGEGTSLRPARSNQLNRLEIIPGGASWSASFPAR